MESRSIVIGIIIGIIVGGSIGFFAAPSPDVSGLLSQIDSLETEISRYQAQVDQLQKQVTSLQNDKNTLQTSLQAKSSEVGALNIQINQLEAQIAVLEDEITSLSSQDDSLFVAASFSRTEDTSYLLQYWIGRANETIKVMVMLITQDELADALIQAHDRGVDVEVVIDDEWIYSSGSDYKEILDAGIDIRGDNRGGLMHHKVMIIDGYIIITGSYNWSESAEDSNDENIIILKSTTIAGIYLEEFNRIWSQTIPPTQQTEQPEEEPTQGLVLINEFEPNPAGIDAGNEWVELYNPTDQAIDISGWTLSTTHGMTVTVTIPKGTIIDVGEHLVLYYSTQWIDNEDESIILRDTSHNVIDWTPTLSDTSNDGRTWQRYPDGYDSDSPSDWIFKSSTAGYSNS